MMLLQKAKCIYYLLFVINCLYFLVSYTAHGQPTFKCKRLSVSQGFSNSRILCMLKDKKGFMWLGTADGIDRYDGIHVKSYKNDISDLLGIYIVSLIEDVDGDIWASGSANGISMYDHKKEAFHHYENIPNDPKSIPDSKIFKIFLDRKKNLWFCSASHGLLLYDKKNNHFIAFNHGDYNINSRILDINESKNGQLFLLTEKNGIWRFDIQKNHITAFYLIMQILPMQSHKISHSLLTKTIISG